MNDNTFKVLVRTDDEGRVIDINSSAFINDSEGWTEIDSGSGDKYLHAQGNYLNMPLFVDNGAYRYKVIDGNIVERSEEEIRADIKTPDKPEIIKRIEAIEKTVKVISDLLTKLGAK